MAEHDDNLCFSCHGNGLIVNEYDQSTVKCALCEGTGLNWEARMLKEKEEKIEGKASRQASTTVPWRFVWAELDNLVRSIVMDEHSIREIESMLAGKRKQIEQDERKFENLQKSMRGRKTMLTGLLAQYPMNTDTAKTEIASEIRSEFASGRTPQHVWIGKEIERALRSSSSEDIAKNPSSGMPKAIRVDGSWIPLQLETSRTYDFYVHTE